jgi:hypothetical protein
MLDAWCLVRALRIDSVSWVASKFLDRWSKSGPVPVVPGLGWVLAGLGWALCNCMRFVCVCWRDTGFLLVNASPGISPGAKGFRRAYTKEV